MFGRVGMRINVGNTVGMVLLPMSGGGDPVGGGVWARDDSRGPFLTGVTEGMGAVKGVWGEYGAWVDGGEHEDTTWVSVKEETELGSLAPGDEVPRTYRMAFPTTGGLWSFPVEGCPERAETRTAILAHLMYLHVWYTVVILYKLNLPHPH